MDETTPTPAGDDLLERRSAPGPTPRRGARPLVVVLWLAVALSWVLLPVSCMAALDLCDFGAQLRSENDYDITDAEKDRYRDSCEQRVERSRDVALVVFLVAVVLTPTAIIVTLVGRRSGTDDEVPPRPSEQRSAGSPPPQ